MDKTSTTTYAGSAGGRLNVSAAMFRTGMCVYNDAEQELLEWVWGYLNQNLRRQIQLLVQELNIPYEDIYGAMTGKPTARFPELLKAAEALKKDEIRHLHIVNTPVTRGIIDTLNYTRDYSAMTIVEGPTGRGKTFTAKYWAALNNHGRTRYVRMTSSSSRNSLLFQLCNAAGTSFKGYKSSELEQRVFSSFSPRNVLIIDEAGFLVPQGKRSAACLELVRDIHDICGCGVCLILTDVYVDIINLGAHREFFEQFRGRFDRTNKIPKVPDKREVSAVVKSYRKDAPRELIALAYDSALKDDGRLRTLFRDLTRAGLLADNEGRPMEADDLQTAIDLRKTGDWLEA